MMFAIFGILMFNVLLFCLFFFLLINGDDWTRGEREIRTHRGAGKWGI